MKSDHAVANQLVEVSPRGRRPITRSMSPLKSPRMADMNTSVSSSLRRSTRLSTAEDRASPNNVTATVNSPATVEGDHVATSEMLDRSIDLNRYLGFNSSKCHLNLPAATDVTTNASCSPAKLSRVPYTEVNARQGNMNSLMKNTPASGYEMLGSSMDLNRKLELQFSRAEGLTETEQQRKI